jgi:phosphonate degradation associated HDIG domain protein
MTRLVAVEEIERLYAEHGGQGYGEGVSQVEHALQCAALAKAHGCPPSLVLAALLHDIGHLFESEAAVVGASRDHRHEARGAEALSDLYGEAVCAPIALHVAAKRWLCSRKPGYLRTLSPASQRSLVLQGGPFGAADAAAFEREPYWQDAVQLRRFDDWGKREEGSRGAFADFAPLLRSLARGRQND